MPWKQSWRCQLEECGALLKATPGSPGEANLGVANSRRALPTPHTSKLGPGGREAGVANARNHRRYSRQRQATKGALKRSSRALPTPGTIGVSLGNATQANLAQENEMHVANSKL